MGVPEGREAVKQRSSLEKKFALFWRIVEEPQLEEEHRFDVTRRWRFDFAHLASKTAVEVEGGVWSGGRHTRGTGYTKDCQKYNAAALEGWAIFRLTGDMVTIPDPARIASFMARRQTHLGSTGGIVR
jgi:very-short-patch-repair endonuclease